MLQFTEVDELLNIDTNKELANLIYIDTDSLFLKLPFEIEDSFDDTNEYVSKLQDQINETYLDKFLNLHNVKIREKEENPLLRVDFKNEYLIKSMVLYAKKRYISVLIKYDDNGDVYYDIDLKGVEGKRATNKFVKNIVEELLEYIKKLKSNDKIFDRFDILYNIYQKYNDKMYNIDNTNIYDLLNYFSLPVNVNKQIEELKNVAGYYKGTIIYDIITQENYWKNRTGKGKWLCVNLKDESHIPDILERFSKYDCIKTAGKKIPDLIRDITIPDDVLQKETDAISDLFKSFTINYDYYNELLLKKLKLMYNPFDENFCDNLLKKKNNDLPHNYSIFSDNKIFSYSTLEDSK